jgi:hypothetical protein
MYVGAPSDASAPSVARPNDWAAPSLANPGSEQAPVIGADQPPASTHRDARDDWVVSIEGVTRAPIDIGFLAGLEVPGRVHVHAGFGWVPSPYVGWITGRIGAAAAADSSALGIIRDGFDSGHAWRVQAGVRPFRDLGLYLDAGYARITLNGSLDTSLASSFVPVSVDGAYSVETALDTWFVELGYLARVGRHVLLGGGLGLMGTLSAETRIAASDARLPQADPQVVQDVNDSLERYGYLPTLSLRGGFDLY